MELELLEKLVSISAISGHEDRLIRFVAEYLKDYCDDVHIDRLGNVTATFSGTDNDVSIAYFAHLDEIGLIVKRVEDNGFLRVERIGGVPEKALLSTYVDVRSIDGDHTYPAVVGTTSHHLTPSDKKFAVTTISEIYIDMGLDSRQEVEALGVGCGSTITYKPNFSVLGNKLASKSMDDRVGVYALLQLAKHLHKNVHSAKVHLIFSIQEEFSVRACMPAFTRLQPCAAICLDIAPACDTPELKGKYDMSLGSGPAITYMNFHGRGTLGGILPNPKLNKYLERIAKENDIPYQREVVLGVVTDDAFTQHAGEEGIAMSHISLPMRYSHAPVEMITRNDLEHFVDLICVSAVKFSSEIDLTRGTI